MQGAFSFELAKWLICNYLQGMSASQRDITVIGAGPAGMFAVFEAGMHDLSTHLVDALPELGGQLAALYPDKPIYDIPGFPETSAGEFSRLLEEQMRPAAPNILLGERVVAIESDGDGFLCKTDLGTSLYSKTVIIAGGKGAFCPRKPGIDEIENYEDRSVFYAVRDAEALRGKKVVIQGGGDSALDWAVRLSELGVDVTLVHRRAGFRAMPATVKHFRDKVESGNASWLVPGFVRAIHGDTGKGVIHKLEVKTPDGMKEIEADVFLPLIGVVSDFSDIGHWGVAIADGKVTVDSSTMQSSVEGICAVGDICSYPGKCSLIVSGFGEVAIAIRHLYDLCRPEGEMPIDYSTHRGRPSCDH